MEDAGVSNDLFLLRKMRGAQLGKRGSPTIVGGDGDDSGALKTETLAYRIRR